MGVFVLWCGAESSHMQDEWDRCVTQPSSSMLEGSCRVAVSSMQQTCRMLANRVVYN